MGCARWPTVGTEMAVRCPLSVLEGLSHKEEEMTYVFVMAFALALSAWTVRLWVLANRAEQVVVLRLERGTFVLGRQADGRYRVVGVRGVPAALARFEAHRTVERWHALRAAAGRPFRWHRAAAQMH